MRHFAIVTVLVVGGLARAAAFAQVGACCSGDGSCSDTNLAGCDLGPGEFLGEGTTCATTVCLGACCLDEKACAEDTLDGCDAAVGTFQGAGTTCALHCAAKLPTAFTYQGQLKQAGVPLGGSADLEFSLWTSAKGGDQVGSTLFKENVLVAGGLLSVPLDFGINVFNGNARWLEIAVRSPHDPGDTELFTTLSPRQLITATPYALQTRGIVIGENGNILFNSMRAIEGTVTYSSIGGIDMILDADTNNVGENQNARIVMKQDGGLVVARMGYREATNTLEIMQEYSSNLVLGTNNQDRLTVRSNGNVGIGDSTPDGKLEVRQDGTGDIFNLYDGARNVLSVLDGGNLDMFNPGGATTITMAVGAAGSGSTITLNNGNGVTPVDTVRIFGDSGNGALLLMRASTGTTTVVLDADSGDGGTVLISAADGSSTVFLDGEAANSGGLVSVRNDTSEETIELLGDDGDDAGRINISNRQGTLNVDTITLDARDAFGTGAKFIMRDNSGAQTFLIDSSNGATGGAFMQFRENDGSLAMEYVTNSKLLTLRNSAGSATITFNGQTGTKSGVATTASYGQRLLYVVEATEVWFEDFGSGQLTKGKARIDLDPIFLQTVTINDRHPMKVFITLTGDANGVYVRKGYDHFIVRELAGGKSNATFDYRIVAKRQGVENVRLEPFQDVQEDVLSEAGQALRERTPRVPNDGVDQPDDLEADEAPEPQASATSPSR